MARLPVLNLALRSIANRRATAILTVLTVAISVMLFLGVEKVRHGARESFENTISGVDLIVGARSSPVNLLLYSVFHIGDATNNITWESYETVSSAPGVAWTVPISLGDSHRGHRVIGSTPDLFEHYQYSGGRHLEFASGQPFIQSLGYAWAVLLVGLVDQKFVSKTFDDIGGDDGPLYAWMAISAAVTAGLLA